MPEVAFRECAFFRIWCVVELAAAVSFEKPVVMLIGRADESGIFVPNRRMIGQLYNLIDVRRAAASVEADRVRELANVNSQVGGADEVNSLARRALMCAKYAMDQPDILRAAMGDLKPLLALTTKEEREDIMQRASAAGYLAVVLAMLDNGADVNAATPSGGMGALTGLMKAAQGGHLPVVKALLTKGAHVNMASERGFTALMIAAYGGFLPVVQELLAAKGADVNQATSMGTALGRAAETGHLLVVKTLLAKGADVNIVDREGNTAAEMARKYGHMAIASLLDAK